MGLVYEDNGTFSSLGFDINKINPNKMWLTHYKNSLYLGFMLAHGTMIERHQASKELKIAERKMAFWARDHRFNHDQSLVDATKAKKEWR
jgi:hypothetical protein